MTDDARLSNRHPVDRLAIVRTRIKELQEQEADLKQIVSAQMGSKDTLGGDEYVAKQVLSTRKGGIDEALLKKQGLDPASFRKPDVTVLSIRVEARVVEEA
ncbi:hypothetical protein [Tianweitania sediminis]|uniref:Uncharacterized protein n=1 Tax=Tianweitania sediminis TaxID=1502156 RepID=A0A8J7RP84_9HYPH|nr:hypothetical protein [Tianweitania sediminis]MBP0440661.1 hypothetical protein [Tianweitania sediminis]